MKIAFIGSVDFSRHCLEVTAAAGGEVVLVLTTPFERNLVNADAADLVSVADRLGLPALAVTKINAPEVIERLQEAKPDILFVFGFSQLISPELIACARLGAVGVHPSPLPIGRGRHPLIWTLINDLKQGALSFFWIDSGADTGDLLWQNSFAITDDDDAGTLMEKIKNLASKAIPQFLASLEMGAAQRIPQDETKATVWRKRGPADGEIQWDGPARTAFNLIRALTRPYVGATTFCQAKPVQVWKARVVPAHPGAHPGQIVALGADGAIVQAGDQALQVLDWSFPEGEVALDVGMVLGRAR